MTNSFTHNRLLGDLLRDPEIEAEFSASAFTERMIAFELAWTRSLAGVGAIDSGQAKQTQAILKDFQPDFSALSVGSNRDGLPVPALVAQMKKAVGKDLEKTVHVGSTSQDVIDTAMVLTLRAVTQIYLARLDKLVDALADLSAKDGASPLMGRTRMQAALPITVGARVAAWRGPLVAHLERAPADWPAQIGGAVGLRDYPVGQADAVAEDLGLSLGAVWHSDRSGIVDFGHWLVLVTGSLGKMGQDIALMAQQGVDEIKLSGGGGSSAMPHKQNPILAETLVTLARFTAAQQSGLAQVMVHEQERSGSAWALEWMILPAMCEAAGAALRHANTLIAQVERIGSTEGLT